MIQRSKIIFVAIFTAMMTIMVSCVDKMGLPESINGGDFFAGDTTYLLVSPVWDEKQGLNTPVEISIAQNGHVYVADSALNSILVLNQSGDVLSGFSDLGALRTLDNDPLSPVDVDIDGKMNVFYIDGSNKVYRWSAYLELVGIDSVARSGTFRKSGSNESVQHNSGTEEWFQYANDEDWELVEVDWDQPTDVIDSLLAPHIFFDGDSPENIYRDTYYQSENSRFTGVSAATADDMVYVTDLEHNRIIRINYLRHHFIMTTSGDAIWVHSGYFRNNVSGYGTGAGRVNLPTGLDTDRSGNIYYSQEGDFFGVSKIRPVQSGRFITYPSVFQPDVNDIMDITRFHDPADVAVDRDQNIYVSNTGDQEIQVFNSFGGFFRKAGVEEIIVDTTIIINDVEIDTFKTVEIHGYLERPSGLAVDERGVIYICDPPTGRIIRYQLSNKLDENLQPQE